MELDKVVNYYRGCVSEEVKNSAFTNLDTKNSTRVLLKNGEKLGQSFPSAVEFNESSKELLELMLLAATDTSKELIYATAFIKGNLNGTTVNAPILYAPCEIKRDKQGIAVSLLSDTWHVNASILSLIPDKQVLEVNLLMQHLPSINADKVEISEWLKEFEEYFETNLHVNKRYEVMLLNMPKASAGILNDLDKIAQDTTDINNTSLAAINGVSSVEDTMVHSYINQMSESQVSALDVACRNHMTAIIGAPGTGKSNTIVGITTHLIANGYTVLISSKMDEAVDVVKERLTTFGKFPFAVRTGSKNYRKDLATLLDDIVDGKFNDYAEELNSLYNNYTKEDLIRQERKIKTHNEACEAKEYYTGLIEGLSSRKFKFSKDYLMSRFDLISAKHKLAEVNKVIDNDSIPYESAYLGVYRLATFNEQIKNRLKHLQSRMARRELILISRMLKSGKLTNEYDRLFANLIKNGIPCWITTNNAVSESIPCKPNLFDFVIIDEASQCDIGTCIPLLYRARMAIVVGDNKQIKYISFMNHDKNLCYAKNYDISDTELIKFDYTKNSMFDFATYFSDEAPVLLTEHFRSRPDLFEFSNQKFYNGKIKCVGNATVPTDFHLQNLRHGSSFSFENVARLPENWVGDQETGYSIVEQDSKHTRNFYEAKRVLRAIKQIVTTNDGTVTIGVLSPFRAQVDLLQDMINHEISLEDRKKFKILVGTAHAFQGNERDIMLNSWVVAKNTHRQSFTFINNPNLFNVSVTRAKYVVMNFLSVNDISDLPDGLLKEYLSFCNSKL